MGFLDRFSAKNTFEDAEKITGSLDAQPESHPQASQEILNDFSSNSGQGGAKFYDPYEGLSTAIKHNRGGFRMPEEPEFLFVEDANQRRRSWTENLCYYTGGGYLAGAILGGGYGLMELATNKPEVQIESTRVKINRFLNTTGHAGRKSGNAFGVLGLFFAAFESSLSHFGEGYVPDGMATVAAGFATGALFRSTRGPMKAVYAGGVGAAAASCLLLGRQFVRGL